VSDLDTQNHNALTTGQRLTAELARLLTLVSDLDTQNHNALTTGQRLTADQQSHAGMIWRIKQALNDELHRRARRGVA